jgi:ribosomal protein S18 acetylase RimI-like enzyme
MKKIFIVLFLFIFNIKSYIEIVEYINNFEIEQIERIFYESFDKKILDEFNFIEKLRKNDFFLYSNFNNEIFYTDVLIDKGSDSVIGFLTYFKSDYETLWILLLAIDKSERKKGYGKLMLENIFLKASKMGLKKISLCTESNNISAISFYEKIGFVNLKKENYILFFTYYL